DARINLGLGLLHGLSQTYDDQNHPRRSRHHPLSVVLLCISDLVLVVGWFLEDDSGVSGKRLEGFVVVEGERRDHNAHSDLKTAFHSQLGIVPIRQVPKELADGSVHSGLLNADGGISK